MFPEDPTNEEVQAELRRLRIKAEHEAERDRRYQRELEWGPLDENTVEGEVVKEEDDGAGQSGTSVSGSEEETDGSTQPQLEGGSDRD